MSEPLAPPSTDDRPVLVATRRSDPGDVGAVAGPAPAPPPMTKTNNPVRIGRIGADQIRVFVRPVLDDAGLLAVAERLEQLLDAGYETIDVVFEEGTHPISRLTIDTVITCADTGKITDAVSR